MDLVAHLYAALNVTLPLLLILLAGIVFRRIRLVDEHFVATGNRLVFKVALPCLLFLSVAGRSTGESINVTLVVFGLVATLLSVLLVWWIAPFIVDKPKRGVFTHIAFRGNMGIIGLALCVNAFGDDIIAMAAVYLAFVTVLYNVSAVLLLSNSRSMLLINLVKNPLIVAILLGGLWSYWQVPLPDIVNLSLGYLAQLTLPLALVCIGASLEWQSLKANHKQALAAVSLKLVILPTVIVVCAILFGIEGDALGVLFLMMATPTAAAAYVMSHQMTPYGNLAAEVITLSTLLSPISVTLGLVVLNYMSLI
ncbi:AEC family transporter [Neptunicella sp. SCSIO 80796]|uniref:AEC family transporter n=1 Tax=Neptunicella plasticusilytica TaxID=3117012 RepID=UPI003A4D36FF